MNDLEAARMIADGDPGMAERMVRDHYASVFRALRHLTGTREDAEDLTQQSFLAARAQIRTFRGASSLRTWIHRIAFNEYAQWRRRQKRTEPLNIDSAAEEPGYRSFVLGESLLAALNALPEKLRVAFLLHEVEELRVDEVARILRIPAGTVKARLFYARRRLRTLLGDEKETTNHEPTEATA